MLDSVEQSEVLEPSKLGLTVIVPTYNESQNIAKMLESIRKSIPAGMTAEIVVVDDKSPDGTADIAAKLASRLDHGIRLEVIRRPSKLGLSSAIMTGVLSSRGEIILVMDGDFSHPPATIPFMVEELQEAKCDIVVASRYVKGGSITGWPFKRKLMSRGATKIAQVGLGVEIHDPMSGFFAFRRQIIRGVKFDTIGYKMLLEMLVKLKGVSVSEIPYAFTNRRAGSSKVDASVVFNYLRAVYRLYRFGRTFSPTEKRTSVRFLSKAGRFYTVGATGLIVNYAASTSLDLFSPALWYIHGTMIGILLSITSNFFLNKLWTFEDMDFAARKTAIQYGMFLGFSSLGALLQLSIVYLLVEGKHADYPLALVLAVVVASVGNFILNKKWTFRERIWS